MLTDSHIDYANGRVTLYYEDRTERYEVDEANTSVRVADDLDLPRRPWRLVLTLWGAL